MEVLGAVPSWRITDIIYLTLNKFLFFIFTKYCAVYVKKGAGNPRGAIGSWWCLCQKDGGLNVRKQRWL